MDVSIGMLTNPIIFLSILAVSLYEAAGLFPQDTAKFIYFASFIIALFVVYKVIKIFTDAAFTK